MSTLVAVAPPVTMSPVMTKQPYGYLPAQTALPVYKVGDEATFVWNEQPLSIRLVELGEVTDDLGSASGERDLMTLMSITNKGSQDVHLEAEALFSGMNGSGNRLDSGGLVRLVAPREMPVPAGGTLEAEILWRTRAEKKDASIWITVGLPIQDGGYIPLDQRGLIFAFRISQLDYPLGTPTPCALAATFLRETIPDDSEFGPGEPFEKSWVIQNSGTCAWVPGSTWAHSSGDPMGVTEPLLLRTLPAPGGAITITVPMTAPTSAGTHRGDWRLRTPTGEFYARPFYVQIVVVDPAGQ